MLIAYCDAYWKWNLPIDKSKTLKKQCEQDDKTHNLNDIISSLSGKTNYLLSLSILLILVIFMVLKYSEANY